MYYETPEKQDVYSVTKKKKSRRSLQKYPALDPTYNLRSRAELLECDYLDKLSDKDKQYLNNFNEEYVNANFEHSGKKIQTKKKHKKESYDRNNARNRDVLTRNKASGEWISLDEKMSYNPEEDLINKISKEKLKKR